MSTKVVISPQIILKVGMYQELYQAYMILRSHLPPERSSMIRENQISGMLKLKTQGQPVNDVYTILFDTYLQNIPDTTFHDYMKWLQESLMDQMGHMQDDTYNDTMSQSKRGGQEFISLTFEKGRILRLRLRSTPQNQ